MAISEEKFGEMKANVENIDQEQEKIRKHIETLYEKDRTKGLELNTLKTLHKKSAALGLGGGGGGAAIVYYLLENFG